MVKKEKSKLRTLLEKKAADENHERARGILDLIRQRQGSPVFEDKIDVLVEYTNSQNLDNYDQKLGFFMALLKREMLKLTPRP